MGLDTVIRKVVAVAHRVTAALRADVTHQRWTGTIDAYAQPTYSSVTLSAIVERKQRLVRTFDGQERMSIGKLTFTEPLTAYASSVTARHNPIDERDLFTLPDGIVSTVLRVDGLVDPSTEAPYMLEVWLG